MRLHPKWPTVNRTISCALPVLVLCIAGCAAAPNASLPDAAANRYVSQIPARLAASGSFTLFKSPSDPRSFDDNLDLGPDGNFWYAYYKGAAIVRFRSNGTWTVFNVPTFQGTEVEPSDVVTGPDGRLWFGNRNGCGVIGAMKTGGRVTEYPVAPGRYAFNLGPTLNKRLIWFTGTSYGSQPDVVGYINAFTGAVRVFNLPGSGQGDGQIALGPDGNLWFAYGYKIGRITPTGSIALFKTQPEMSTGSVIAGPDGNVWFIGHGDDASVGRINKFGQIQSEYGLKNVGDTEEMVVGPDGNVWITTQDDIFHPAYLVRMDSPSSYTTYRVPNGSHYSPDGIVVGTDGNLWFDLFGNGNPEQHGIGMGRFVMPSS